VVTTRRWRQECVIAGGEGMLCDLPGLPPW
jgi:hypothetical protein